MHLHHQTYKHHQREPSSLSVGFEALPKEHKTYFSLFIKHTVSSNIQITNKTNPNQNLPFKASDKDLLWHKIFSGPQSWKHTGGECNSWAKQAFVHDCLYWKKNTKSLAQYCESELRGNNLVLIAAAFF